MEKIDTTVPKFACVGHLANLEGLASLRLPGEANISIANVESRVRVLENVHNIFSPPPASDHTWSAISWRISRIARRFVGGTQDKSVLLNTVSESEVSLEDVKNAAACVLFKPLFKEGRQPPWPEYKTDNELMSAIVQRLCFAAGHYGVRLASIPMDHLELYALAADLSFICEKLPIGMVPTQPRFGPPGLPPGVSPLGPPPGIGPPGQPPGIGPPRCCNCHRSTAPSVTSFSSSGYLYPKKSRKQKVLNFVRMLFCMKPKQSDESSVMSFPSSRTVID